MNENFNGEFNTEELKNQTKQVIDQVKDDMKSVDVKEEAKATKGFIKELIKNPLDKINEIANNGANNLFKTAIVLIILWTAVELISGLEILFDGYEYWYENIISFIKTGLRPVFSVLIMSFVLLWLNQKNKKSLITYITTVTTVKLPIILADIISLATLFDYGVYKITGKIYTFANLISTVLLFFGIKALSNESDDKNAFRKFVIAEAVWIVVYFIISFFGISMS